MATEEKKKKATKAKKTEAKKTSAKKAKSEAKSVKTKAKTTKAKAPKNKVTKNIGLSLGADLCWPACYEGIMDKLKLEIPFKDDLVNFAVERITVEPFNLRQPCKYDLILDRLTHWFYLSREWVKKSVMMDGAYVLNNPWSIQSTEKHSTYVAMMKLGLPIPETYAIPQKSYEEFNDLQPMLNRYARLWSLEKLGEEIGYPLFMKPYDGGGWVGVSCIRNEEDLKNAYDRSGARMMHLQKGVGNYDLFTRSVGIGPQINHIRYEPSAPLHKRYQVDFNFLNEDEWSLLNDITLTINSFFNWDFNSCETLRVDGSFIPIDFANACPDSQVTSLHYYFPWLVKALIRWSVFCAATSREMKTCMDWDPYFKIAKKDLSYREKVSKYADIARDRLEIKKFVDFNKKYLSNLDEVVLEFFRDQSTKEIIRKKVESLFPPHEIDIFTNHFWGMIQFWCKTEEDRIQNSKSDLPEGVYLK